MHFHIYVWCITIMLSQFLAARLHLITDKGDKHLMLRLPHISQTLCRKSIESL